MIIDTHVHICNMLNFVMTEEMVIEMMDKYHIDYCVVSNIDSAEYNHDLTPIPMNIQKSQKASFERAIKFARANPDRIGIMPCIKPATESADATFEI